MDNFKTFLELDLSDYLGEWVAISNNKIIAHSKDINELKKVIKNNKKPLITKIPKKDTLIF